MVVWSTTALLRRSIRFAGRGISSSASAVSCSHRRWIRGEGRRAVLTAFSIESNGNNGQPGTRTNLEWTRVGSIFEKIGPNRVVRRGCNPRADIDRGGCGHRIFSNLKLVGWKKREQGNIKIV